MSSGIREPLDDLVAEVPQHLVSGGLARTAWVAGRRRRLRRRLLSTALAAAVVAFVAGGVLSLGHAPAPVQPAGTGASPRVGGYPERIVHQWWTPALPDRPGPVAGLLDRPDGLWDVVSESGRLWRSPAPLEVGGQYPTLSRDGRLLGYLAGLNGPFVVRDLVTGAVTRYRDIGCGCSSLSFVSTTRFWMEGQTPSYWAPDDAHLLLRGSNESFQGPALLLGGRGQVRLLRLPGGWSPAGWASSREIVWTDRGHRTPSGRVVDVRVTGLSGDTIRTLRVLLPRGAAADSPGQWTWTVSPDGRELSFTGLQGGSETASVATYSLQDGSPLGVSHVGHVSDSCASGWAGRTPTVAALGPSYAAETVTATPHPRPLSVTDPALGSTCVIWASGALAGTPHGGLFGTATAAWTWWWKEAVAGIGALALAALAVRLLSARRAAKAMRYDDRAG